MAVAGAGACVCCVVLALALSVVVVCSYIARSCLWLNKNEEGKGPVPFPTSHAQVRGMLLVAAKRLELLAQCGSFTLQVELVDVSQAANHLRIQCGEFLGRVHTRPHPIGALDGVALASVVCGGFHACCLDVDGNLYTWGSATGDDESNGNLLGHGAPAVDQPAPLVVEALRGVVAHVAAASYQTSVVTTHGDVYAWGDCDGNALGLGLGVTTDSPRLVTALQPIKMEAASCGYTNEGVLTRDKELFLWGGGCWDTEAGLTAEHPTRYSLAGLSKGHSVAALVCGQRHSCIIVEQKPIED